MIVILPIILTILTINGKLDARRRSPFLKIAEWKSLAFDWPYGYDEKSIFPLDIQPYSSETAEKLFITIRNGPFPLGVVTNRMLNGNPIIEPFPDKSWYVNQQSCQENQIMAVNRIVLDKCGNLWVVDNGFNGKKMCQPQVLVFDAETQLLVFKITLGWDLLKPAFDLTNIKIDSRGKSCLKSYAYISNGKAPKLIVVDMLNNKAWLVKHLTFKSDPDHTKFKIGDDTLHISQGIVGMDIFPYWTSNQRELESSKLFYGALSGVQAHYVNTSYLINPVGDPSKHFYTFPGNSSSQNSAIAINTDGIAFFGKFKSSSLNCWNTKSSNFGRNIKLVYRNPKSLQYLSGVKVTRDVDGEEELWILSSRVHKIILKSLNIREFNFRIMKAKIEDVKMYTDCY